MKIVVLFPTSNEGEYFSHPEITVVESGVGLTATAYATTKAIIEHRPDMMIMAGIAGVYAHSSLRIGDCVLVSSEHEADLGFFYTDGFRHITDMKLDMNFETNKTIECPYLPSGFPIKYATSNSMNAAMADFVETQSADIENMEGSAFFYVCKKENIPFLELRSISNIVDKGHGEWDYETSIKNLTKHLNRLIEHLNRS